MFPQLMSLLILHRSNGILTINLYIMKAGKKEKKRLGEIAELLSVLKPHQVESLIQFLDDDAIENILQVLFQLT